MTQCCLILLFYVKEDYNHRRVDDKDDTVLPHPSILFYVKEDYNSRRVDDKDDTALPQPHPSILCKGRLQPQEC